MDTILWVFGGFFFMVGGVPILFWLLPMWIKNMYRSIKKDVRQMRVQRINDEMRLRKAAADIDAQKKQADFEIEKQRENMKLKFCPYCGTKRNNDSNECENCGSDL
jgi:hypothetical protein